MNPDLISDTARALALPRLKQAAGLTSGGTTPGKGAPVAKIKQSQIRAIAEQKMPDLNANSIEMAMKTIEGSARAMGLQVVEG